MAHLTGPQHDPQPGDTTTAPDGTTYTVGRVEVRTDPADSVVYDTTGTRWWPMWLWAVDCGGVWTYARPEASAPAPEGPRFDPQPGDTLRRTESTCTVTRVTDEKVYYTYVWDDDVSSTRRESWMHRETWADHADYTYTRPAPKADGPRFDPQPGDTMTFHYCDGPANVRTVKARDGDNVDFEVRWVRNNDRTYLGSMDLEDWQDDGGGDYTYARPEAPKARTAEDARVDPQPGDTMTYAHDEDVYTVTSTDADSVTCTVRLPRTNSARAEAETARADLDAARAEADAARAETRTVLEGMARAVALAERIQSNLQLALAGWDDDRATLESAALYLTACRAVMSPDQHAVVEILVGRAPRA